MRTSMIMYNISHKKCDKMDCFVELTFHLDSTDHLVFSNLPS